MRVDLNADLGEAAGEAGRAEDRALLDLVTSANIACGFHAGDRATMDATVREAHQRGVVIGAHPSYPDIEGFGRRELNRSADEIHGDVSVQLHALGDVCAKHGARLAYVKPHGALYNRAAKDADAATAIVSAMMEADRSLVLLGLPASRMEKAAAAGGIGFAREAFVDRAYQSDGRLVPRSQPDAVLHDVELAVERALRLLREGVLRAIDGDELHIDAQSLCVHGDNPDAKAMLVALRNHLQSAGVKLEPFTR